MLLDIRWPHEKIHRLQGAHANDGNLSFPEFIVGSLSILSMSLPNIPALAPVIGQLDYFTKLSLEAHDQPWPLVTIVHREVLLSIEHSDLGLTDFNRWQALRAKRHVGEAQDRAIIQQLQQHHSPPPQFRFSGHTD